MYKTDFHSHLPTSPTLLAVSIALACQGVFAAEQPVLEEVIVTAEHRKASVQDTQISISAFSAQTIQDMGITNSTDLGHVAPNLVVNQFQGGKTGVGVNMRGMAQNETLVAYDPAIGVYIDDVLISKNVGALLDIIDIERIEILRGPQGTLYGRNTMGGTVNYITRKPTDEFEGMVQATVGKYAQKDLKAVVNLPITDANSAIGALSARVTAANIRRDGITDNLYNGPSNYNPPLPYDTNLYGTGGNDSNTLRKVNDKLGTKDRQAAMVHLKWDPTDNLSVLYTWDYTRIDEVPDTPFTTTVDPTTTAGGFLAPYAIGRADRPETISVDGAHLAKTDVDGQTLHIDLVLTEDLTLKSITAKREMENYSTADSDGSPVAIIQTVDTNINDQFTQEFRLTGTAFDGRLEFTTGVFYMDETGKVDQRLDALLVLPQPFGGPSRNVADFENKNWALYGQATWSITDRLRFTAGVRYTEEDREMSKIYYPSAYDKSGLSSLATMLPDVIDFGTAQRDFDNVSPMVSVSYDWTDNLMTYFKVSTGFQSGGFNVRDTNVDLTTFAPTTFHDGFDEETLLAYELGMKADIADRVRVNTALWYSDYDDKRVNNFDPNTLGNTVRNAGVVEIYGMELEVLARLNQYWELGFNYGYQHPEYKEYKAVVQGSGGQPVDLSDTTNFPYTPKNSAGINLTFETPLDFALLRARLDWAFKDGYTFLAPQPERNSQKAYQIWNARVALDEIPGPGDTTFTVALWGKNITDESYYYNGVNIYDTFGFDINLFAEPRTYGLDVALNF